MIRPADFENSTSYFQNLFRSSKKLSLNYYSKKLSYKSSRLLQLVCQGRRLASQDFLLRVKQFAALTEEDFVLLNLLVSRDRLKSKGKITSEIDREISLYRRKILEPEKVSNQLFSLISEWYFLVLRQILKSKNHMSIESLQKHLRHKVTKGQLAQAIQTLQNLGFISVEENGNIKSLKPHDIFTGFDAPSQAVRSHHKQMMERAKESLDEISVLDREILSLTFGFNPQHLTKVKEEIRAFRDKIDRKYGDDKSSSIFQLNVQFFGHTEN